MSWNKKIQENWSNKNNMIQSIGILSNWKEFEIIYCKINSEFVHMFQMFIIQDISRSVIQNSGFIKQKILK